MENSQIVSIGQGATDIVADKKIDANGNYILPGGIDIHVHGGGGHDFMEGSEEAFRVATQTHLRHGTTAIFPTLAASSTDMIMAAAATTEKLMAEPNSIIMGLNLEGPYFNMAMAGGQIPEYIPTRNLRSTHIFYRTPTASSVGTLRPNWREPLTLDVMFRQRA